LVRQAKCAINSKMRNLINLFEMKSPRFAYLGNCTNQALGPFLEAMMDAGKRVAFKELLNAVGAAELAEVFPQYFWGARATDRAHMRLNRDPNVSFYRSAFRGVPCYYVVESGIENIFVDQAYWDIDLDSPERDRTARRACIGEDGTVRRQPMGGATVLSVIISRGRVNVVQSSQITPACAVAMLKILDHLPSVTEIDDDGEAMSVEEYRAMLHSHLAT
jgi:hypothetical protein